MNTLSKQQLIYMLVNQQASSSIRVLLPLFPKCATGQQQYAATLFIQKMFTIHITPKLITAVNQRLSGKHYLSVNPLWLEEEALHASNVVIINMLPILIPKVLIFLCADAIKQHCLARLYQSQCHLDDVHTLYYMRSYLTAYYLILEKHLSTQLHYMLHEDQDPMQQLMAMTESCAYHLEEHLAQVDVNTHQFAFFLHKPC